ncbi:MAG: phosphotransferase [Maritimibacter sp.]|nr:phosphotransferase [Maritimibacter sp.]
MPDPHPFLALWRLSAPEPLKQEGHAHVWRVTRTDGTFAALKIFLPGRGGNERNAAAWHRRYARTGLCPAVLAETGDAVLYDWAPGDSLGDLFRAGEPDRADALLGQVMAGLHAAPADSAGPFVALRDYARALATFTPPGTFTAAQRADMARAAELQATLLARTPPGSLRLLHGDLHHDNVLGAGDRWAAIDPKAVIGDIHFEPANAFRNPNGGRAAALDPARIDRRADLWAAALGLDRARLLDWAAAKCALSIAWTCADPAAALPQDDLALLSVLLARAG